MTDQTTHQQYIVEASEAYQSHNPGMYAAHQLGRCTCVDTRIRRGLVRVETRHVGALKSLQGSK